MLDLDTYINRRRPLWHARKAIESGKITIGFVGGSITEAGEYKRWSDKVADWFVAEFPGVTINVENAAKGATGSLSAILRIEDDILFNNCDIVFVETAVNDAEEAWGACREGIIRKLLKNDTCDVVITYTYTHGWYGDMLKGKAPPSIMDWMKIARHYNLSDVFMSRYAFDQVMRGFLRWEEWLPDNLHPEHAGSRIYAEPVCRLIETEMKTAEKDEYTLPAPLYRDNWENAHAFPLENVVRHGAWRMERVRRMPSVHHKLYTTSMTSSLSFEFEGTGVLIHLLMSAFNAGYHIRVDGGEWIDRCLPVPDWAFDCKDWVKEEYPVKNLSAGKHTCEIRPVFLENGRASNFELCSIGIVK